MILRRVEVGQQVYEFQGLTEALFLERQNRFLARVLIGSQQVMCHLHDPGRLPELVPRSHVLVRPTHGRKTNCSLTAFSSNGKWVVCDSRIHSRIASEFLPKNSKPEVRHGASRLDFFTGDGFVEVKGCTLVKDGVALFPDSPTTRGRKHVEELRAIRAEGMSAGILVLVMRNDAVCFRANSQTDPAFASSFSAALKEGVEARILTFSLDDEWLRYRGEIPLCEAAGEVARPRSRDEIFPKRSTLEEKSNRPIYLFIHWLPAGFCGETDKLRHAELERGSREQGKAR